jgi:hypothetical protein
VSGKIDYTDVLNSTGKIIDFKTAAHQKPSELDALCKFRVPICRKLSRDCSRKAEVITFTKTKTSAVHRTAQRVPKDDLKLVEWLYPLHQEEMRSGLYLPNRASYLCSRKSCACWPRRKLCTTWRSVSRRP